MKPQSGQRRPQTKGKQPSDATVRKSAVQKKPQTKARSTATNKPVSINYVVNQKQLKHQLLEKEKQEKRDAFKQQKDEKAKKFNDFQKRKFERNKILGQKTRRGQPVMKGRMEMLLNQIQYKISKEST